MPAEVHKLHLPPHSVEAEQAVLGSLMLDTHAWSRVAKKLGAGDFFRRDHQRIFEAIKSLCDAGKPADAVTVNDTLEREGLVQEIGGLVYLAELVRETPSSANVESYADAVRDRALLRRLQAFAHQVTMDVGNMTADEALSSAQAELLRLQSGMRAGRGLVSAKTLSAELIDDLERRREKPMGMSVGLEDFDELTCGLEPGDLVVLAGRPGMGKTALMVTIDCHVSQHTGVAVFSAEMSSAQLMRRHVSLLSEVSTTLLRRADKMGDEHWAALSKGVNQVARRRLFIDDTPSPSLTHIRAESMALKARHELGLILVDYMQLVQAPGENQYHQLRQVAYGMKDLAKDLQVPVIVLAQLNRAVEARDNKRPRMSDLRDSGAIEEAADIIGLLYSEGYYDRGCSMPYVLECALGKMRNAERGECLWNFTGAHSRVEALSAGAKAQYRHVRASKAAKRGGNSGDDL